MGGCYIIKLIDEEEPMCYLGFSVDYLLLVSRRQSQVFIVEELVNDRVIHRLRGRRFIPIRIQGNDFWERS